MPVWRRVLVLCMLVAWAGGAQGATGPSTAETVVNSDSSVVAVPDRQSEAVDGAARARHAADSGSTRAPKHHCTVPMVSAAELTRARFRAEYRDRSPLVIDFTGVGGGTEQHGDRPVSSWDTAAVWRLLAQYASLPVMATPSVAPGWVVGAGRATTLGSLISGWPATLEELRRGQADEVAGTVLRPASLARLGFDRVLADEFGVGVPPEFEAWYAAPADNTTGGDATAPEDATACSVAGVVLGRAGAGLPWHWGQELTAQLQLSGTRRWRLSRVTPSGGFTASELPANTMVRLDEAGPVAADSDVEWDCTVGPGQALYVPADMYRLALNTANSISATLQCGASDRTAVTGADRGGPEHRPPASMTSLHRSRRSDETPSDAGGGTAPIGADERAPGRSGVGDTRAPKPLWTYARLFESEGPAAVYELFQGVTDYPGCAELQYQYAAALLRDRRPVSPAMQKEEAMRYLIRAANGNHRHARARGLLADVCREVGATFEALEHGGRALELDHNLFDTWQLVMHLYAREGQLREARSAAARCARHAARAIELSVSLDVAAPARRALEAATRLLRQFTPRDAREAAAWNKEEFRGLEREYEAGLAGARRAYSRATSG